MISVALTPATLSRFGPTPCCETKDDTILTVDDNKSLEQKSLERRFTVSNMISPTWKEENADANPGLNLKMR